MKRILNMKLVFGALICMIFCPLLLNNNTISVSANRHVTRIHTISNRHKLSNYEYHAGHVLHHEYIKKHKHHKEHLTRHQTVIAKEYKKNSVISYHKNIKRNKNFKIGEKDSLNLPSMHRKRNNSNYFYKLGWIDGDVLDQASSTFKYNLLKTDYQQLKAIPKSYYWNAITDWNNGQSYLKKHHSKSAYLNYNGVTKRFWTRN